jgi:hypothetical protein
MEFNPKILKRAGCIKWELGEILQKKLGNQWPFEILQQIYKYILGL